MQSQQFCYFGPDHGPGFLSHEFLDWEIYWQRVLHIWRSTYITGHSLNSIWTYFNNYFLFCFRLGLLKEVKNDFWETVKGYSISVFIFHAIILLSARVLFRNGEFQSKTSYTSIKAICRKISRSLKIVHVFFKLFLKPSQVF